MCLLVGGVAACGSSPENAEVSPVSSSTTAAPAPTTSMTAAAEPTPTTTAEPEPSPTSAAPSTSTPLSGADIAQLVADAAATDGVTLSGETVACIEDELVAEGIVEQVNDHTIDLETAAVSMLACLTEAEYEALIG